jgi:hypothetical protein
MPSTGRKLELKAKTTLAQTVSQPFVYAKGLTVWPARGLNNFICAASILRLCEAVKFRFSNPYKNLGKTKVLYNFKTVSVLTFRKIVNNTN